MESLEPRDALVGKAAEAFRSLLAQGGLAESEEQAEKIRRGMRAVAKSMGVDVEVNASSMSAEECEAMFEAIKEYVCAKCGDFITEDESRDAWSSSYDRVMADPTIDRTETLKCRSCLLIDGDEVA